MSKTEQELFASGLRPTAFSTYTLYRCPACRSFWAQREAVEVFSSEEAQHIASQSHAQLSDIVSALCRLCALPLGLSVFSVTEHCPGLGYSLHFEKPDGLQFYAGMFAASWVMDSHFEPHRGPVTRGDRLIALLGWLRQVNGLIGLHLLTERDISFFAQMYPPAGPDGTWEWKGVAFQAHCEPLQERALLALASTSPARQPLDLAELIRCWRKLCFHLLAERLVEW
jgi:hypothetical protein